MGRKKAAPQEPRVVRQCANIKSKKLPDVRCPAPAAQGEFCARHSKNPHRFQEKNTLERSYNQPENSAAARIQSWWTGRRAAIRILRQGPLVHFPELAENTTDMFTLDPVRDIPLLYRWSYIDDKNHGWIFDIRSLSMSAAHSEQRMNPYTREPIGSKAEAHFHKRCSWLRSKKYCLVHSTETEMTPEQLWNQKVLDVSQKYDMLGYHMCLHWFEELPVISLALMYIELWELWFFRLNLSRQVKEQVVPRWSSENNPLFKVRPSETRGRHDIQWWRKIVLELLDRFVSSATLKDHKTLGALYGMTGFALVSHQVRQHYPWLVELDG
jgi:hypothetical protein